MPVGDAGARIYVEPDHSGDTWRDFTPYRDEYDHWLWKEVGANPDNPGGHGGIDYILQWRIVQQMRAGLVPDFDVYDSAAWCSPVPLSVTSLKRDGRPVDVPDFTRGRWAELRPGLDSRRDRHAAGAHPLRPTPQRRLSTDDEHTHRAAAPGRAPGGAAPRRRAVTPAPAAAGTVEVTISEVDLDGPTIADVTVTVTNHSDAPDVAGGGHLHRAEGLDRLPGRAHPPGVDPPGSSRPRWSSRSGCRSRDPASGSGPSAPPSPTAAATAPGARSAHASNGPGSRCPTWPRPTTTSA